MVCLDGKWLGYLWEISVKSLYYKQNKTVEDIHVETQIIYLLM